MTWDTIGSIRSAVDAGSLSPAAAFQAYSNVIDTQLHSFEASDQDNNGGTLSGTSVGGIQADYGVEMASQEATLVDGALADRGLMSADARQLFNSRRHQPARVPQRGLGPTAAES